jgi:pimeloyl-ACP methyl ester carboxylesterase
VGEPLVLLHGQGLSRRSWDPVVGLLTADWDVLAVDLPGHGESPRQPRGAGNTPADLAAAVAELLDELGLESVHVAGNSNGGWVALELARLQRARTVVALSPGGLWRRSGAPAHIRLAMRQMRVNARIVRRLAPDAPRSRVARTAFLALACGHPSKVPHEVARTAVHDMATARGFRETLRAAERTGFRDGADIAVPVTVAYGTRDRVMLPRVDRRREELPAQTQVVRLPGCGHIAMFDDPRAVAALVLDSTRSTPAVTA